MRCIFCLLERAGSEEHVFPLAIGGRLVTDRVCGPCNSTLGSRVDAALTDHFVIRVRRAELGLKGNSGAPPELHEFLEGVATLADDPDRRVQVRFNQRTKRMDIKALYQATDITLPDGSKGKRIIIDQTEIHTIPTIIQRERKRHGLPPATSEHLEAEVERAIACQTQIDNPSVLYSMTVGFEFVDHALLKIIYELAFLWLGDEYLDDPRAAEIRAAIQDPNLDSVREVGGYYGDASGCTAFKFWNPDGAHHIAYACVIDQGIMIAVRIFDLVSSVVLVTADAARYLRDTDGKKQLRFLAIDAERGKMHQTALVDEFARLVMKMAEARSKCPLPDPLSPA